MHLRQLVTVTAMTGLLLLSVAGPAQAASTSSTRALSDENLVAQAAFCVPCGLAAAALAVRIARTIRLARAARLLRAAKAALRPDPGVAAITTQRLNVVRRQAQTIARRGKRWTKRNWPKIPPYVRACIAGVATLETGRILEDGKISRKEWEGYVSIQNLGNLNPSYLDLYIHPVFDFNRPTDGWAAACAVALVGKRVGG